MFVWISIHIFGLQSDGIFALNVAISLSTKVSNTV